MIGQTARFLRLRWILTVHLILLCTTMGGAAALAERGDFGRSSLAPSSGANAFDGVASHELSKLTSKGAKDWAKGASDVVPPREDLLQLQEIARRAVETGKQSTTNPVQSQRLQKIHEALKNLGDGN